MRLFHVSDLHYHRDPADNKDADGTLEMLARRFDRARDYLVVTGDVTDDGHEEQYRQALAALQRFGEGRVFVCPGNHDFGAAGNFYDLERAHRFDEMMARPLKQGGTFQGTRGPVVNVVRDGATEVMLIALDSNLETAHPFDFACGEIGEYQLKALETLLTDVATSTMFKLVLLHHHPFIVNDPFMELKDARALMRLLYARVDVLAFGHKHAAKQWRGLNGIDLVLAADNTPRSQHVVEITLQGNGPPSFQVLPLC